MDNAVCRLTGCEFPLFAFSHCRDVVVAVSKAGGFGVLGATRFTPDQLEEELAWIDAHIDGAPYGVDVLVPEIVDARVADFADNAQRAAAVSAEHRAFTAGLLNQYGIAVGPDEVVHYEGRAGITPENGYAQMEVAFRHPIRLIANALGIAPPRMIEEGKKRGVRRIVRALGGRVERLVRTRYGTVALGGLAPGSWRRLSRGEVARLRALVSLSRESRPARRA